MAACGGVSALVDAAESANVNASAADGAQGLPPPESLVAFQLLRNWCVFFMF